MNSASIAELRRNWLLLLTCALGVGCSAVSLPFYMIGPLTKPIEAAMGWSRTEIQFAAIFSSGIGIVTTPIIGWLIDRYGARVIALPSVFGVPVGLGIASTANTPSLFYLGFAMAAILGAGTNPVLWSRVVAGEFDKARGAALGLALIGTAVVALTIPTIVVVLSEQFGWRTALRVLAIFPVLVVAPMVWLWLHPKTEVKIHGAGGILDLPGLTLKEATRHYRFWILFASILCAYLAISGLIANLVPALSDKGLSQTTAAALAGAVGMTMIPGRILAGVVIDRVWAPIVGLIVLTLPGLACLMFVFTTDLNLLFLSCALLGLAAGAELDLLAFMTAKYFGLKHYSKIYAIIYAGLATGSATAPMLFSSLRDFSGDYELSFFAAGGLFFVAALLLPALGRYPSFAKAHSDPER